jgi:isoleucyl-tRNA synthetase
LARRSAQTALHQITHAMLRWMAPFLSFTAEEAWEVVGTPVNGSPSIFTETFLKLPAADDALLAKWSRVLEVRAAVNKAIEDVRAAGQVGSSLQATVRVGVPAADKALLDSLGDDLKFVLIVSAVEVFEAPELTVQVQPSSATKCARCWHYRDDVGHDAAHPHLCGRCTSNLHGAGETRTVA